MFEKIKDFVKKVKEYYPLYLTAHQNANNRKMHMLGQIVTLFCFVISIGGLLDGRWLYLILLGLTPFVIYLFAWTGHLVFEKNKPATWTVNPLFTKICDIMMFIDIVRGKIPFNRNGLK